MTVLEPELERIALQYLSDLYSSGYYTDRSVMIEVIVTNLYLTEDEAAEVYDKWRANAPLHG